MLLWIQVSLFQLFESTDVADMTYLLASMKYLNELKNVSLRA